MNSQALYDLSPLARMMAFGIVLAAVPLLWVAWRKRNGSSTARLHALTLVTLFLTFDLVLFGAFTRLSDSGLGCPDWPGCYGHASPLGAQADIAVAQSAMPTGPVTRNKAWIEMVHRYLATGVGVLILVLAVASWLAPGRRLADGSANARHGPAPNLSPTSPWLATATLVWVCVQGAFGALTVTMKLFPAIVTLHLMGGLVLLALLCMQVVRQYQFRTGTAPVTVSPAVRALMWATFGLLAVQIALGGWVSTNYAVLACNEFPRCQNSWWPEMDFDQGFQIWRKLGLTQQGEHIGFAALTAIHYAHRMMAAVVLLAGAVLAWVLNGVSGGGMANGEKGAVTGLRTPSRWIAALIGLQLATGLSNVVLDWPLLAALLHTGGAGALVIVMTWVLCVSGTRHARSATHIGSTGRTGGADPAAMHTRSMTGPGLNP
jgi:heme a synthase